MQNDGFKMVSTTASLHLFKVIPENMPDAGPRPAKDKRPRSRTADDDPGIIRCRQCRRKITHCSARTTADGQHTHAFANPHGIVFEIGCFKLAAGCAPIGPASIEFTWFEGYSWQIIVCGFCRTHLGWLFSSKDMDSFYGLILDRLLLPDNRR
jgi:hypothetical protein